MGVLSPPRAQPVVVVRVVARVVARVVVAAAAVLPARATW